MALSLPHFPASDIFIVLVSTALVSHQVFKRYEPDGFLAHFLLLIVPPALSTLFLSPHFSFLSATFLSFTTYFLALIASLFAYRLSPLHPLARYPGPVYLKLSKFPTTWVASKGTQHKYIKALHERYGDVVRTGPNEFSVRDSDALVGINTLPKGPRWINAKMSFSDTNSLIAEHNTHEHARRRKPWNRAFNTAAIKEYEEVIAKRVSELVDALASQKSAVDLGKWISWWSYDFMSDMVFGGGSEMMRDGDAGSNWHVLNEGIASFHVLGQIPWATIYARRVPALATMIQRMVKQGVGLASQRLKAGSVRRDLFYYLNNEDGAESNPPPFKEVVSNGTLAMVAGSDTTSIALSNLFYFILKDGDAYKRLQSEVDSYFPPGENALDAKHHPSMPFLNAVINETLRLIPIVPDGSQRVVPKGSGGRAAGPYYIPEGTVTYVHYFSLHRDPKNFSPATESFWPDRWLLAADETPSASAAMRPEGFVHNPAAFVPFSFGPNNCVGKALALQEMRMLVCALIQKFDMRFPDGWNAQQYEDGLMDFFTVQKPELRVVVMPR